MNQGSTIFSQIMGFLPKHNFRQCVSRYKGNYRPIEMSWCRFDWRHMSQGGDERILFPLKMNF